MYSVIRRFRLDSIAWNYSKSAAYFLKFFISKETGIKFISNGSWTILPGSFAKYENGYLVPKYGRNSNRGTVEIFYVSAKGVEIFKTFGGIRHIHKISVTKEHIIVTTGDIQDECRVIFMTFDGDVTEVISKGQVSRTTDVHCDEDKCYWIMDSEYVDSKCIVYDRALKTLESVHNVRQPSWHSIKIDRNIYFSTTIESKSFWKGNYAAVYKWNLETHDVIPVNYVRGKGILRKLVPPISIYFELRDLDLYAVTRGRLIPKKKLNKTVKENVINLDLLFCETHIRTEILANYSINNDDFVLNVIRLSNKDDRWLNYLLKRIF
ncbi:hypothetical protein N8Z92_04570 [Schleiferiaceae bacterium]|nr:hypothetical protein [Schleiferiaceae bacterium]